MLFWHCDCLSWVEMFSYEFFLVLSVDISQLTSSLCWQLAGVLSVTSRFLPTVMNLLRRLAEEAQGHPAPETPSPPHSLASHSLRTQTYLPNLSVSSSVPDSSVSTHISSTEGGVEYSSPQLTQRRGVNVELAEFS